MTWTQIIEGAPETLPPLKLPVFAAGGNMTPRILVRIDDPEGWVWSAVYGAVFWRPDLQQWAVWETDWDDEFQPECWHPFPVPPGTAVKEAQ